MYSGKQRLFLLLLLLLLVSTGAKGQQNNPDFVWIEAEQGTANISIEAKGWGKKEFLSGEKWVQVSVEADKVEFARSDGDGQQVWRLRLVEVRVFVPIGRDRRFQNVGRVRRVLE